MSRLPFEIMLALRYLRPKRTFVSVITLICIIGVMLGVAVLIVVISVMAGFDRQLRDKILGFDPHIRITRPADTMRDHEWVSETVAANPAVKGVAPYVMGPVLAMTQPEGRGAQQFVPVIRGIDPVAESRISTLGASNIIEGEFNLSGNGILIGRELAYELRLEVGDRVSIFSAPELMKAFKIRERAEQSGELDEAILPTDYEIKGIFDVGFYDFNANLVVCSLMNAQDLFALEDGVNGLMVMLHDPARAAAVQSQLQAVLPDYDFLTWEEKNSGILEALHVEKNVMFYLLFFIMIVAAFGITSALITFVVQKTREIGVLKAIGASSRQIVWIFLSQSLIVGVMGVIAGFGLGLLAVEYRNEFLFFLRRVTGFELFPKKIYQFAELPALIDPGDIAVICGGSLIICILAGLIPAWNAGRLKPVEALRHE